MVNENIQGEYSLALIHNRVSLRYADFCALTRRSIRLEEDNSLNQSWDT
jgi:hypothetical protein